MANDRLMRARTAGDVSAEFRKDSENERLYRESEVRRGLAERMKSLREAAGISQEELGKRVGCKQPFIAKLEGGAYERCGIATLRTFARALEHDIDVAHMFIPLGKAIYSGRSSCVAIEADLDLQEELAERLASVSLARWVSSEAHLNSRQSIAPNLLKRDVSKEVSAAA